MMMICICVWCVCACAGMCIMHTHYTFNNIMHSLFGSNLFSPIITTLFVHIYLYIECLHALVYVLRSCVCLCLCTVYV